MTWLITLIVLGESDRTEINRPLSIFSIFDFKNSHNISQQEFTIMLLCILSSFGFILNRRENIPSDMAVMAYCDSIYDSMKKKPSAIISVDDFNAYVKDKFISQGYATIDLIFEKIIQDCHGFDTHVSKILDESKKLTERSQKIIAMNAERSSPPRSPLTRNGSPSKGGSFRGSTKSSEFKESSADAVVQKEYKAFLGSIKRLHERVTLFKVVSY